jgi:predicted nucleic acid-binding protein
LFVDASIAIKWLVPEIHSDAALRLLEENNRLTAPDLIFSEIGNVLLKKPRSGEIEPDAALEMLTDFKGLPLQIYRAEEFLEHAWTWLSLTA